MQKTEKHTKKTQIVSDTIKNVFRAYDIGGIYGKDVNEEVAETIGKSIGTVLGNGKSVGVGRDVRLSSKSLHDSLVKGLLYTGCKVVDFGIIPTPLLYFGTWHNKLNSGVMVTASHLPPEWNGFKISGSNGVILSEGTGLEKVKEKFFENDFIKADGGIYETADITPSYVDYVVSKIDHESKFKIVFDFGNSVTSLVVPKIMEKIGHDASWINYELDGTFPNRTSEPTEEALQGLKNKVLETGADIGIGYDGDGDRVAIVDEKGRVFSSGNVTIPLLAKHMLSKTPKGKIVYDITCSPTVGKFVEELGGESVVTRVGHSYCVSEVMKQNALFGGQYSGHTAFPEVNCADDAIFGSLKIIEALSASKKKLSKLIDEIPSTFTSKMEEIPCADPEKFSIVNRIKEKAKDMGYNIIDIDGVVLHDDTGRVLIRASNTTPVIRVNAEGKTKEACDMFHKLGESLVRGEIAHD